LITKTTLPNGVRILTEEIPCFRSVAIGIWVPVGSRDEADEISGVSHFIEHLLFKGTSHRTAKQIAEALDAVGGQLNAFTTKEYTCYYARVLDEHFDLAADILVDMLFNSLFSPDDIERERNVIIEEIKMYEDTPDEMVHDVFAGAIWKGHALGRPIIGSAEAVASLSRDSILDFYTKHYRHGQVIVAAAGNINHDRVVDKLAPLFAQLNGSGFLRKLERPVPQQEVSCRQKDTEQVHVCVGTQGLRLDDDQLYVLQVINTVLGGGMSSRLFQEIREQRGLVYSVYSYHASYHDTGLFAIYAGLSKENVNLVLDLIARELGKIRTEGIGEEELRRAKDQLKGNFLLSLESVTARMSRLGKLEMYLGKIIPPEEVVQRIEEVTPEQVRSLAATLFRADRLAMATVGTWCDVTAWREATSRLG